MARKVDIQYYTADGECRIETVRLKAKWIEMPDGAHPKTNDSFWHDAQRKRRPVICISEGVTKPLGGDMTEHDLATLVKEINLLTLGFMKTPYSRMFWRQLAAIFEAFTQYGMTVVVMMIIIGVFVNAFLG